MVLAYLKYRGRSPMDAPVHRAIRSPPHALWNERTEEIVAVADMLADVPNAPEPVLPVRVPRTKRPLAICSDCAWMQEGPLRVADLQAGRHHEATGHTVMVFEDKWMALIPSPSS